MVGVDVVLALELLKNEGHVMKVFTSRLVWHSIKRFDLLVLIG